MKRLTLACAVLAALAISSSVALAAAGPTGTYKTTVTSNAAGGELKGPWTIAFSGGGYTVKSHGKAVVHGKFTVVGSKITFDHETGPAACPATGTYTFKLTGQHLAFTRLADGKCLGRSVVLAGGFTKS